MTTKRSLGFIDILGLSFAAVFSLEVVASLASVGPSLVTCFIVAGASYFICHALLCAELGTAYPGQGGIYLWIKQAFGEKWAARSSWCYWVNLAAFIPSALIVMVSTLKEIWYPQLSVFAMVSICLVCVWIIVLLNSIDLDDAKWITTIGSVSKAVVCICLIGGGAWAFFARGSQTTFTPQAFIPKFNLGLLAAFPLFVYALTGFDVVSASGDEIQDPGRDVPRVALASGALSLLLYVAAAFSLLVLIPQAKVSETSGFVDGFFSLFGNKGLPVVAVGITTVLAFLSSTMSWSVAGNKAAAEASRDGELPAIFGRENRIGQPVGAAVLLGLVSTVLLIGYGLVATTNEGLFWTLLAFNSIVFFIPYAIMALAFIRLRLKEPLTPRPFRIPGPDSFGIAAAITQFVFLFVGSIGFLVPPEGTHRFLYIFSLVGGICLILILGEILITYAMGRHRALQSKDKP